MRTAPVQPLSSHFDASLRSRIDDAERLRSKALHGPWIGRSLFAFGTWLDATATSTRRRLLVAAPVVATATALVIAALISPASSVSVRTDASQDSGFTARCEHQHHTVLASQPLGDPSAQALLQRRADDSIAQNGNVLLGSGAL